MNTTTRRLLTTAAGVALAAATFSATGPAADAAKPAAGGAGGKTVAIQVYGGGQGDLGTGIASLSVDYMVPVDRTAITSVSCTLDGVPQTFCGNLIGDNPKQTNYWGYVIYDEVVHVPHTFTVSVVTKKATYVGSTTLQWTI